MKKKIFLVLGTTFLVLIAFINISVSFSDNNDNNSSLFSLKFMNIASAEEPTSPPTPEHIWNDFLENWKITGNTHTYYHSQSSNMYSILTPVEVYCPIYDSVTNGSLVFHTASYPSTAYLCRQQYIAGSYGYAPCSASQETYPCY